MEVREQAEAELLRWALATPLFTGVWARHGRGQAESAEAWCAMLVDELVSSGALQRRDTLIADAA
jgi:hypothetical protein